MTPEEQKYFEQMQMELQTLQTQGQGLQTQQMQQNMWQDQREKSMIQDQLDLAPELERIEHLLRGHVIRKDAEGNEEWQEPEDPDFKILNEYGVHQIMNVISFYINKDTLLSNYDEDTILQKMEDFATDLADLIFMKYREMGMDTSEKRKSFAILVRQIQDIIHSTYLRALGGKERESLRRHMHVSETQGMPSQNFQQMGGSKWNPLNWLRR